MRHFLLPGPVAALPFGVGVTAAQAVLVSAAGGTNSTAACLLGTPRGAVAVATIAVAADQCGGAASGAQVASSGKVHWPSGPMENRRRRARREILCRQRRRCWGCGARHRNWLGGWDRCRACVSTGRSAFYRIGITDATATQPMQEAGAIQAHRRASVRPSPIPCIPSLPRFACQTTACCAIRPPEALRAANRKTGRYIPEIQKTNISPGTPSCENSLTPNFYVGSAPLTTFPPCSSGRGNSQPPILNFGPSPIRRLRRTRRSRRRS